MCSVCYLQLWSEKKSISRSGCYISVYSVASRQLPPADDRPPMRCRSPGGWNEGSPMRLVVISEPSTNDRRTCRLVYLFLSFDEIEIYRPLIYTRHSMNKLELYDVFSMHVTRHAWRHVCLPHLTARTPVTSLSRVYQHEGRKKERKLFGKQGGVTTSGVATHTCMTYEEVLRSMFGCYAFVDNNLSRLLSLAAVCQCSHVFWRTSNASGQIGTKHIPCLPHFIQWGMDWKQKLIIQPIWLVSAIVNANNCVRQTRQCLPNVLLCLRYWLQYGLEAEGFCSLHVGGPLLSEHWK